MPTRRFSDRAWAWSIAGLACLIYAVWSLLRWWRLETAGYDLGIFDTVVRAYSQFQAPIVWLKGDDFNIWGDHFHPILVLLAPLYWIWDDPRMLLVSQAVLVSLSIPLVYGFARRRMSQTTTIWLTLGYAFSWAIQTMINFDFHEIAFGIPLIALAIDSLDRRRDGWWPVAATALLFVREDMGMIVMLLGLLRVFRRPRWVGWLLLAIGPVAFVVIIKVILPAFSPTGEFGYWAYDALGPDATSAIIFMIVHPIQTLELFFWPPIKLVTFAMIFGPVLFLSFRSPLVILTAPLLAQRFFASRATLWQPSFHYNAPIWLIAVLAAVDGASRLSPDWRLKAQRWLAGVCAGLALLPTIFCVPIMPFRGLIDGSAYHRDRAAVDKAIVLAEVPANTCVAADDRMADKLLRTNRVTLPGIAAREPDFIVLDLTRPTTGTSPQRYPLSIWGNALADGWVTRIRSGAAVVLQNPSYAGPSAECGPL